MSDKPKNPVRARCSHAACDHVWPVLYTPMEASLLCKILKHATCPICGDTKPLLAISDVNESGRRNLKPVGNVAPAPKKICPHDCFAGCRLPGDCAAA